MKSLFWVCLFFSGGVNKEFRPPQTNYLFSRGDSPLKYSASRWFVTIEKGEGLNQNVCQQYLASEDETIPNLSHIRYEKNRLLEGDKAIFYSDIFGSAVQTRFFLSSSRFLPEIFPYVGCLLGLRKNVKTFLCHVVLFSHVQIWFSRWYNMFKWMQPYLRLISTRIPMLFN